MGFLTSLANRFGKIIVVRCRNWCAMLRGDFFVRGCVEKYCINIGKLDVFQIRSLKENKIEILVGTRSKRSIYLWEYMEVKWDWIIRERRKMIRKIKISVFSFFNIVLIIFKILISLNWRLKQVIRFFHSSSKN